MQQNYKKFINNLNIFQTSTHNIGNINFMNKFCLKAPPLGAKPSLGGTIRNHLKKWLTNYQKQPNHFFGPFSLSFLTIINYYFFMFINYML
jgi:hypothetical protein